MYLDAKYCLMYVWLTCFLGACLLQNFLNGSHSSSTISSPFLFDVFVVFSRRYQNLKEEKSLFRLISADDNI